MTTQEELKVFYQVHLKPKLIAFDKQRQILAFKLGFILIIYDEQEKNIANRIE
jgi:hypothetical protein